MNKKQREWKSEFNSINPLSKDWLKDIKNFEVSISLIRDILRPEHGFLQVAMSIGFALVNYVIHQNRNIIWLKKELKKAKKIK